ncbi:MAG: hypothetical protein AB1705_16330 [Verrucomicrobiota bacterium]
MTRVGVKGIGAVSPAGWGVGPLSEALRSGTPVPAKDLQRPGWERPLAARTVPAPQPRPAFMTHPRLRRSSPITHYAVGAALEALGDDAHRLNETDFRLGVVLCVLTGCVNYSRRFYDEVWKNPAQASPLVFPETVFNAPSSHLATLLGASSLNYTLVGDHGMFLQGLAVAADWLLQGRVEGCLVVGSEEIDWLPADAIRLFHRSVVPAEGAGAVYLCRGEGDVALHSITDAHPFLETQGRADAAQRMRDQLPPPQPDHLLCDGTQAAPRADKVERHLWRDWPGPRLAPKAILGEAFVAAAAWQCVAAIDALRHNLAAAATVSVVGCNQQAIGAHLRRADQPA